MLQSFRASLVSLRGPLLLTLAAWSAGCSGAFSKDDRDVSLEDSLLGGMAGSGTPGCNASDTADTTCNGVDDDCDGDLDENCDFNPSSCPAGYRRIIGTAGDDTLIGTLHRDCIVGYGGDDAIYGLGNDDLLVGGPGDDVIQGGSGNDKIRGGDGADEIEGGLGKDNIEGGAGNDVIDAGSGDDTVQGGMCHDRVAGGLGKDDLRGNDGSDRIVSARVYNRVDGGNGTDACHGTSCEVSPHTSECRSNAQCPSNKQCVIATGICVTTGSVPFTDPTCNGVDDDCDGRNDEEFVGTSGTCGVGACQRSGSLTCEDGEVVNDSCTPGTPAPNDASCNAIDDDCNGLSDEDFMSAPTGCGVGACQRTGMTSCTNGTVGDNCTPGAPASDANCNGSDNDCDGRTDEHFVSSPTTCGVGACAATGSTTCVGGSVQSSCTPGPASPDTSCDGVDQDCDGRMDEGYVSQTTTCGMGGCQAFGSTSCVGGMVQNSCTPGAPIGNDSTCDGFDDDCDGQNDEGYVSQTIGCGVGACAAEGSTFCVGGDVQNDCSPGTPAAGDATCNDIDDDCNGQTDEDFISTMTSCGVGECASTGATSCVGGIVEDSCEEGTPEGNDATCDGEDEDCDGETDEGFVSMQTTCGVGECASMGATSCVDGMVQNSCVEGTPDADDATCDGLDDDCSGQADEDFVSTMTTCGVGECAGAGATSCVNGNVEDSCETSDPGENDADCDDEDDDCNGAVDEDFQSMETFCGVGACASTGETSCVDGSVEDSCVEGTPAADDASCNNTDDDCSGAVDEDFEPTCLGSTRITCVGGQTQSFECSDGTLCNGAETCSAGVCQPGVPDEPTDDGDPCTTDSCDPATGDVTHTPVPSGTSCSDGEICNGEEVCLGGGGAPGCAPVPSGGVSWWRAEGNANDSIGPHHGTLLPAANPPTFVPGHVGQAFNFDGVNDHVSLNASAAALDLTTGTATLEFWMNSTVGTCQTFFSLRQNNSNEQFFQLGDCITGGTELLTWRRTAAGVPTTVTFSTATPSILLNGAWHHVAITLDGTNTVMYVDGSAVSLTSVGTDLGDWGGFAPTLATIGARDLGVSRVNVFRGGLDEMTLYDRALSAAEINSIRLAGMVGKCTGASGPVTCTPGTNEPMGTMCEDGGECDGAGNCE
jgi:hypothetical protein